MMTDTAANVEYTLMSATTSSSGKRRPGAEDGKRGSVAGLRSSSPSHRSSSPRPSAKDKSDEVNRKLDYLLKKTRKLEDSLSNVRSENVSLVAENKKTQECTVNMWESIKKDRESVSSLRGEVSILRTKLDLLHQKTTLLESSPNRGVKMEEIGMISEQVFGRVHREFSTVVDEVVRACVKEQVDFLTKWTAKGGLEKDTLLVEENKSIRSEINNLQRQQEEMEISLNEMEDANHEFTAAQKTAISDASTATRGETQRLLEAITKQMNDSVAFAITNFQEEMSTKYDGTMHQLINSCNDLQVRIAESEDQLVNVDASIADTKDHADVEISNLSSIVSMAKETVQRLEEGLEEMKEDAEEERRRRGSEDQREPEREQQFQSSSGWDGDVDRDRDTALACVQEQLSRQEEHMSSYLQLLEEHRSDYTETISRLSAAGRLTKSAHLELAEEVHTLRDSKASSDEVLGRVARQGEEDRAALAKLAKDNSKLFVAVSDCQKGLASKKSKKKEKGMEESSERGVLDASQLQEVTTLKERMDIFEESVIDTVQEMIDTHHAEALHPLEKRLEAVERSQERYSDLVTERVDSFHSAEIIPLVSSVHKVERLVESVTARLARAEERGAGGAGGTVASAPPAPETLTPPRASQQSTRSTTSSSGSGADINSNSNSHNLAITDQFRSSKLTSDHLSSSSSSSLPFTSSENPVTVSFASNLPETRRSSSSNSASVFTPSTSLHSSSAATDATAGPGAGMENKKSNTTARPRPLSHAHPNPVTAASPTPDTAHKPKYHPPQSFNLTNTLSSAHEIMPATDIPHLSTLPDLRKSQKKDKHSHAHSHSSQFPQRQNQSHESQSQQATHPHADMGMGIGIGIGMPVNDHAHNHDGGSRRAGGQDFRQQEGDGGVARNNNNNNNNNNNSNNNNLLPGTSSSSSSLSSPSPTSPSSLGVLQTETLLKSLQDKKKKHRKKFQSQVKSEINASE